MALQLNEIHFPFDAWGRGASRESNRTGGMGICVNGSSDWRFVFSSVRGTSHGALGQKCQDSSLVREFSGRARPQLLMVAADGAGSSTFGDIGSRLACDVMAELVSDWVAQGQGVADIGYDTVRGWFERRLLPAFALQAENQGLAPRDFATTLLAAIIGTEGAVFFQIGDGGIVIADSENRYKPVFWPQSGEYVNSTFFVTDSSVLERMVFECSTAKIDEVAVFTDGLQMLALKYDTRSVHEPFFFPMFQRLREEPPGESSLASLLDEFLMSRPVCSRTDDDKTLLLATRRPPL